MFKKSANLSEFLQLTGFLTAAIAFLAMLGWIFDSTFLKSMTTGFIGMNPMTAIGFLLLSVSLITFHRRPNLAEAAALIVLLIGLAKMLGLVGIDLHFDHLLFDLKLNNDSGFINRISYLTAAGFIASATSLVSARRSFQISQVAAVFPVILSYLTIVAFLFGVNSNTQIVEFTPMALNTAFCFSLCSMGSLALTPQQGFTKLVLSPLGGGYLLKRAIPAIFLVPLFLGWLRVEGESAGLFQFEFGASLMVAITVTTIGIMIYLCARAIDLMDNTIEDQAHELQARLQELEALNSEMESFSYSVSHDLRAPLRSMAGFSEMVLEAEEKTMSDSSRQLLQRVVRASSRMGKLIDGLLNLSRLSRKEINAATVSFSEVAERIVRQLQDSEPERKVEVELQPEVSVHADEQLLEVVLQNLIGNAWKFTGKSLRPKIEIGRMEEDGREVFFVRDNGAGFDMSYSSKLFGAFQRLHPDSEFEGTGIGLATVRRIINKHGGTIWAEASPGAGATFYFTFKTTKEV